MASGVEWSERTESRRRALQALLLGILLAGASCSPVDSDGAPGAESPGDAAAAIELVDLEGKLRRPLGFEGERARVFVFSTVDCPVANGYSPEIVRLASTYRERGVAFFLVHVDPETDAPRAREHAREFSLDLPVLLDPDHRLVEFTGVTVTPEAALVLPDGTLAYRGRIDNLYADYGKKRRVVTVRDLEKALGSVLEGKPIETARTEAVGCIIADFRPASSG